MPLLQHFYRFAVFRNFSVIFLPLNDGNPSNTLLLNLQQYAKLKVILGKDLLFLWNFYRISRF